MKEIIVGPKNSGKTTLIKNHLSGNVMPIYWGNGLTIVDFHNEYNYYRGHGKITIIDYSTTSLPECPERIVGTLNRYRHGTIVIDGFDIIMLGLDHSTNASKRKELAIDIVQKLQETNWFISLQNINQLTVELYELAEKIYLYPSNDDFGAHGEIRAVPAQFYHKLIILPLHKTA